MKKLSKIDLEEIRKNIKYLENVYDIPSVKDWWISSEDVSRDPVLIRKIMTILRSLEGDYER